MTAFNPQPKTLASILPDEYSGDFSKYLLINDIHTDSREVEPGSLFIALNGARENGERFIPSAVEKGAVAILVDHARLPSIINVEVPVIGVHLLKERVPQISHNFFGGVTKDVLLIGVTGTNGKSTITSLVAQLGELAGIPSGIVGTLGYGMGLDRLTETGMTTPDTVTCHRILAELTAARAELIAMEVSSHGIDQQRIGQIPFDVAVISNITRDHLDYHETFAAYANTKKSFILSPDSKAALINRDDPECCTLIESLKQKQCVTYSTKSEQADVHAHVITYLDTGMEISISSPWGQAETFFPLVGDFNLSNLLAALSALCMKGYAFERVVGVIPKLHAVPGRLERVNVKQTSPLPQVFIDFAHTPDALLHVLRAIKKHVKAKLWLVFGCGGDRDIGKRSEMGKIAGELADRVIVTSDNPRTESPSNIIADITAGIVQKSVYEVVEDRRLAISLAIDSSQPEDTVLIAGKGHESYQVIGNTKMPFQDLIVAKEMLARRSESQGGRI